MTDADPRPALCPENLGLLSEDEKVRLLRDALRLAVEVSNLTQDFASHRLGPDTLGVQGHIYEALVQVDGGHETQEYWSEFGEWPEDAAADEPVEPALPSWVGFAIRARNAATGADEVVRVYVWDDGRPDADVPQVSRWDLHRFQYSNLPPRYAKALSSALGDYELYDMRVARSERVSVPHRPHELIDLDGITATLDNRS